MVKIYETVFRTVWDRVLKVSIRGRFWFGTVEKCMLDFVVAGFWTVHDGF